jgi:hypothetical protein
MRGDTGCDLESSNGKKVAVLEEFGEVKGGDIFLSF